MTIRRQWLLVLIVTALIAVSINTVILSSLINRYFLTYNTDNYNSHVEQIKQLAGSALSDHSLTSPQLKIQFESHLEDPIININLYDTAGHLIVRAENTRDGTIGMMNGMMRRNSEEVDNINVMSGGVVIGVLNITRYSSLNNSIASAMFRTSLIRNSFVSLGIVLPIFIVIGIVISRRLSRDLMNTASQTLSIDMGVKTDFKPSKVKEISIIQTGLTTLQNRLKIKQIGRKRIVDELVHQTRTPLTILKTHLEGLEDGMLTMSDEEIKVCQSQVDSISAIISNMSMLLDADKPVETVTAEEFELHALFSQIVSGLRVQFEKKKIDLKVISSQKVTMNTDKNKLSQCIYNLLTNAYKFTEPGGIVEVAYEATETEVLIRITDTGVGISKEDIPHLFDAYYRGNNAAAAAGEGLGLFVVKETLEQLGGAINVSSDPNSGSEFVISIPVKQ